MLKFDLMIKQTIACLLAITTPVVFATEAVNFSGVEITSDRFSTNLITSLSRLEGNVTLSHQGIKIEAGYAEAHPETTEAKAKFILGQNIQMTQAIEGYSIRATAAEATYLPNDNEFSMRGNVQFKYQQTGQNFNIRAEDLQVNQQNNQLASLLAKGKPGILTHVLDDRRIIITAASINWQASTEIAIMLNASLDDGSTTFSASEIEYNTRTGAVSAKGQGDERPRYRLNTIDEEQNTKAEKSDDT